MQHFHFQMLFELCVNKMLCEKASCKRKPTFQSEAFAFAQFSVRALHTHPSLLHQLLPVPISPTRPFNCRVAISLSP